MLNLLRALVLAACMLPGVAAAQCFSSTPLPANTVLGRLGIGPGPCQAIPFTVLLSNVGSVPLTRNINTTAPLAGGGNLGSDRTLSLGIGIGLTTSGGNLILANPSASTIGGVESLAAVSHQWINSISTSGVPSSTQPAFTDISGQATLAQLPTINANSVLGNNTGSPATPIQLTNAQITAMINAATASLSGALPAWPNNTTTFFRGDGTYATVGIGVIGGLGTGVATALGVNVGSAGAPVLFNGALGTPSSATLTNGTGLPIAGIASLGTNVATALATATGAASGFPKIVAGGTIALGTSGISAGTCGTAATATATGTATTDEIDVGFSGDPTATTGYTPSAMLTLVAYPTVNTVNVKQCNLTGSTITPSALTLNWWVRR